MKSFLRSKKVHIIGTIAILCMSFILFNYSILATYHGNSDAPIIVGILGLVALIISYIYNLKIMSLTTTFGYIFGFFIGVMMETEGIVFGDELIHELWVVWIYSYWILIVMGLICDFILKIKYQVKESSKKVGLYIGIIVGVLCILGSILAYSRKSLTMNDVMKHKPKFYGTVIEIYDEKSILVKVKEHDPMRNSSDKVVVPLDIIMEDMRVNIADFHVGDEIKVYYDGNVAESYPAQIFVVYAIFHIK